VVNQNIGRDRKALTQVAVQEMKAHSRKIDSSGPRKRMAAALYWSKFSGHAIHQALAQSGIGRKKTS